MSFLYSVGLSKCPYAFGMWRILVAAKHDVHVLVSGVAGGSEVMGRQDPNLDEEPCRPVPEGPTGCICWRPAGPL